MQILHRFAGSLQRYSEELSDPDRYRPDHCPQCEAHRPPFHIQAASAMRALRLTSVGTPRPSLAYSVW